MPPPAVQAVEMTPARGPALIIAAARASITPLTTAPQRVFSSTRLKTAMVLKLSPTSLTTWLIHMRR